MGFADDTGILATGRTMEEYRENLQPALDHIKRWTQTWKVEKSASKCAFTIFTLYWKETNGKLLPNLFLGSEELR